MRIFIEKITKIHQYNLTVQYCHLRPLRRIHLVDDLVYDIIELYEGKNPTIIDLLLKNTAARHEGDIYEAAARWRNLKKRESCSRPTGLKP